jgi:putative MATE family efflux protein
MNKFDKEIVSGSIVRSVWKLAWPLVLLNLVSGINGLVDQVLVGHFVYASNNAANAAIGISWQVFMVVVVFISSLFHGLNVMISRYAGMQDRRGMSNVFYQVFLCSVLVLVGVVAPVGYLIAPLMLNFVHAGDEVGRHALPYLRMLFVCGAPLFLMFLFTGAFQASGDPRTPLKLGVLTTLLKIAISLALIVGLKMGTMGAALGTAIAPLITVCVAISLILRGKMILHRPDRFGLLPKWSVIESVVRIGVPTGLQGVLLNVGGVLLLKYIGSLDQAPAALAAYTICYSQLFNLVTWTSFGLRAAAGTMMGQNIGAGNPARGKRGVAVAGCMGAGWAMVIGLVYWMIPVQLLALFNAVEEPVVSYGVSLLHILAVSGVLLATTMGLTGGIQGAGYTKAPMYIAFFTQIVILLGVCAIFQATSVLTPQRVWLAILISHGSRMILTYAVFRSGKWAHTKVDLAY